MFGYYLGTFWIVLGTFFLWRPASLTKRLKKKGIKLVRRYVIAASLFGGGTIFGLAFDMPGIWPKLIAAILVLALWFWVFRWYQTMKKRFAELVEEELNPSILKRIALVHVVVGIVILVVTVVKMTA